MSDRTNLKNPLSVLMVCPQFYPIIGGYERSAERLGRALVDRGHHISVVTERRNKKWPRVENQNGTRVFRWWTIYKRRLHTFTSLAGFAWIMLRESHKYDVIHIHQYGVFAAASAILGKIFRVPTVLKLTNTGPEGIRATLDSSPFCFFLVPLHRKIELCVATTKDCYREAVEFGFEQKRIGLIGNGVDTNNFVPSTPSERLKIKKKLGLSLELLVLFVGRLESNKRPFDLIDAWKRVMKECPDVQLAVVGDGSLLDAVKTRSDALDIGSRVIFPGRQNDILPWYQAADIYVTTSNNEGLSNALLEALSCGLPVVSTKVSGSADIIAEERAGNIVNVGDIQAIASSLLELINDEEYRKTCGKNGRRFVVENYAQELIAEKMEALYYSVCGPTRVEQSVFYKQGN